MPENWYRESLRVKSERVHSKTVKIIAHRVFCNTTAETVQNCIALVEEQEAYYCRLHEIQPLTVENIDEENSNIERNLENVGNSSESAPFYDESQIDYIWTEPEIDAIVTTPEPVLLHSCPLCDFTTQSLSAYNKHLKSHKQCVE